MLSFLSNILLRKIASFHCVNRDFLLRTLVHFLVWCSFFFIVLQNQQEFLKAFLFVMGGKKFN